MQLNNNLTANGQPFYFDTKDGKYGWNESSSRGADTFHPFKAEPVTKRFELYNTNRIQWGTTGWDSVEKTVNTADVSLEGYTPVAAYLISSSQDIVNSCFTVATNIVLSGNTVYTTRRCMSWSDDAALQNCRDVVIVYYD